MAFAAVLFALPVALASAIWISALNGLGLSEVVWLYMVAGIGAMISFLLAAGVADVITRD